ncbi:hypothetical protein ES708_04806 [subsurface metagenome]
MAPSPLPSTVLVKAAGSSPLQISEALLLLHMMPAYRRQPHISSGLLPVLLVVWHVPVKPMF